MVPYIMFLFFITYNKNMKKLIYRVLILDHIIIHIILSSHSTEERNKMNYMSLCYYNVYMKTILKAPWQVTKNYKKRFDVLL